MVVKESVQQTLSKMRNQCGKSNILVNNAGTSVRHGALELTVAEWDQVMDMNLKSVLLSEGPENWRN